MLGAGCTNACFSCTMGQASCCLQSTACDQEPLTASFMLLQNLDLSPRIVQHTMAQATPRQLLHAVCILRCGASLEDGK